MNKKSINDYQSIHCIGIGGSGMSALAAILHEMGKRVSGSDQQITPGIERLKKMGIAVHEGHSPNTIPRDTDVIVYSSAIPSDNVEREEVLRRGLPEMSYAEAVGTLTKQLITIAVCGTHGKTTTTGLISSVFIHGGMDPTIIIGSPVPLLNNKNERLGKSEYLILEACEYRRSFINYFPETTVITNIEVDHLDYYKNVDDYQKAFETFLLNTKEKGKIIVNADDDVALKISKSVQKQRKDVILITYGTSTNADFLLKENKLSHKGKIIAELNLRIPGQHNLMNAAGAFAASFIHKIDIQKIQTGLNQYDGAERRFQYIGQNKNAAIYDDYGHHPTEIRATLKTAREKFGKGAKILCIFQPHQYSRTKKLLNEFSTAFKDADEVIIPNIYQVRDTKKDIHSISAEGLVKEISKNHPHVSFGRGLTNTTKMALQRAQEYDIIMIMGAGNITEIGKNLIEQKPL